MIHGDLEVSIAKFVVSRRGNWRFAISCCQLTIHSNLRSALLTGKSTYDELIENIGNFKVQKKMLSYFFEISWHRSSHFQSSSHQHSSLVFKSDNAHLEVLIPVLSDRILILLSDVDSRMNKLLLLYFSTHQTRLNIASSTVETNTIIIPMSSVCV